MFVKILVIAAIVMAIVCLVLCIHNVVVSNKVIGSMRNWAEEVDRNVNAYIRQEFARMRMEENNNNSNKDKEDGRD